MCVFIFLVRKYSPACLFPVFCDRMCFMCVLIMLLTFVVICVVWCFISYVWKSLFTGLCCSICVVLFSDYLYRVIHFCITNCSGLHEIYGENIETHTDFHTKSRRDAPPEINFRGGIPVLSWETHKFHIFPWGSGRKGR